MSNFSFKINKLMRRSFVILLFAAMGLSSSDALHAQRTKEGSVRVISILTRRSVDGAVVTLSADTPLTRTQMWRDGEGFHIVLPDAGQSRVDKVPPGVKVSQVGRSLEVLLQTQPGADVRMQPLFNRLTLLVRGGLDTTRRESFDKSTAQGPCPTELNGARFDELSPCDQREFLGLMSIAPVQTPSTSTTEQAQAASPPAVLAASASGALSTAQQTYTAPSSSVFANMSLAEEEAAQRNRRPLAPTPGDTSTQTIPANIPTIAYDDESDLPPSQVRVRDADNGGFVSNIFSPLGAVAFLGPGLLLLLFFRQRRSARAQSIEVWEEVTAHDLDKESDKSSTGLQVLRGRGSTRSAKSSKGGAVQSLEMDALELTLDGPRLAPGVASTAVAAAVPYGEERSRQEVSMLVKGLPYCLEVLSSRAVDDRRVIELSLVEVMNALDLDVEDRARARRALEDYGFVLRRGSTLLSAPDASERALAARTLAEMSSPASMPFLLEAINDPEDMVRAEALSSLGVLKIPSAIGPLLDTARRWPQMPISLLSDVLGACSFESPGSFDAGNGRLTGPIIGESGLAEKLRRRVLAPDEEDMPESIDDDRLTDALSQIEDEDLKVRVEAARALGQFNVKCSLRALTSIALLDLEPGVRAAAATSLGNIRHEYAFAHLLIAHSDESREVQAAAARSLSRLGIDRAEAFIWLLEMADEQTLRDVMRACIKTGMVSQAVSKLASTDRHQAYEAFSLLSLLEKLDETQMLLGAIEHCQDGRARSAALGMFGLTNLVKAASPPLIESASLLLETASPSPSESDRPPLSETASPPSLLEALSVK